MKLTITIQGEPVAKERARVVTRGDGTTKAVTPARTRAWEEEIRWRIREAYKGKPDAESDFGLIVTAALGGRDKDWDNLGKCASDAANGLVWKDDRQVTFAVVRKYRRSETPYITITYYTLEDGA